MSSATSSSASGSSRIVTGQARAALGELRAGRGRGAGSTRRRRGARRARSRSRNVSSPHWMSSKTTTSGRSAAACSSVLRNAQAISSADVAASVSPSNARIADAAASSEGSSVELLQDLHDGPVGDPHAVGKAAAADDCARRSLRAPPRPAATCRRRRHRRPSRARSAARPARAPRLRGRIASSRSRPTKSVSCRRSGRLAHVRGAGAREPARPCP